MKTVGKPSELEDRVENVIQGQKEQRKKLISEEIRHEKHRGSLQLLIIYYPEEEIRIPDREQLQIIRRKYAEEKSDPEG